VTSEEGKRGLVFRGELRSPGESIETEAKAQEPESGVAPAKEKAPEETVKVPNSEAKLKRPADKRHALLRIEKENAWIRCLDRELGETFCTDRELGETFCTLITKGDTVTVAKTALGDLRRRA